MVEGEEQEVLSGAKKAPLCLEMREQGYLEVLPQEEAVAWVEAVQMQKEILS